MFGAYKQLLCHYFWAENFFFVLIQQFHHLKLFKCINLSHLTGQLNPLACRAQLFEKNVIQILYRLTTLIVYLISCDLIVKFNNKFNLLNHYTN